MSILGDVDAVYFLMFAGWKRELRSNRWHYASRWARHVPVVLVQPDQVVVTKKLVIEPEPRIANCEILSVKTPRRFDTYGTDMLVQLGQVLSDMERRAVKRPLLWFYNPHLLALYAGLPASVRVFHATENYFDFEGLSANFLDRYKEAITISDAVVAVSEGVAASLRSHISGVEVNVVSNGCDYREYSLGRPDPELVEIRRGYEKIAIYAGNINSRLDYRLIHRCVREYRTTCFSFFGRGSDLTADDSKRWAKLLGEPNVRYFGEVVPERLPDLYSAADVGFVPYKQTRLLVENGFPLKVLEMCATGLPVVSTLMKPIAGLTRGLVVAADAATFIRGVGHMSRSELSEPDRLDMDRLCRQHDYDEKFREVLRIIEREVKDEWNPETRLDAALSGALGQEWKTLTIEAWSGEAWTGGVVGSRLRSRLVEYALQRAFRVYGRIPLGARHLVPRAVRRWVRERVFDLHW
jgi:hypothetical protein